MPQRLVDQGIVVHLTKTGDAHRVVHLLTAEHGLVACLARGARASKRRFAGVLDLFATLQAQLQVGRDLWTLVEASLVTARLGLRADLQAIWEAGTLCAAARALAAPLQPAPELFAALTAGLDAAERGDATALAAAWLDLGAAAGILPEAVCGRCHATQRRGLGLDTRSGALVCEQCVPGVTCLRPEALAALDGTAVAHCEVARQVRDFVLALVGWHSGRPLRVPKL